MEQQNGYMAKKVSMGGIITTLSLTALYLTALFPTNRISLFALSTMFIFVLVIKFNIRTAFISYTATSLLGLILLHDKLIVVAYILYFGYYGIMKNLIERLNNVLLEWTIKIISYNIALLVLYVIARGFFPRGLQFENKLWLVLLFLQAIFIIYDILYSYIIMFYRRRINKVN